MSATSTGQQVTKGEESLLSEPNLPEATDRGSILTVLDSAATFIVNKHHLDKPQAYLVITLVILIVLSIAFIISAWKFYSPVILQFSAKEERIRKTRSEKKKEE